MKARKLDKMVLEIKRWRVQPTVWFRLSINDLLWGSGVTGVLVGLKIRRTSFDSRLPHKKLYSFAYRIKRRRYGTVRVVAIRKLLWSRNKKPSKRLDCSIVSYAPVAQSVSSN